MSFWKGFAEELLKLASEGTWGMGGSWIATPVIADINRGPLLTEQAVPRDVDLKNIRRDYFYQKVMAPEEGKAVKPGRLGDSNDEKR